MVKRSGIVTAKPIILLVLAIAYIGCSSGGGGSESNPNPPPAPTQQVLPATYDFGTVTVGNAPAPLAVKINNNGTANLRVSGITLSDLNNFTLNLAGGTNPCNSTTPTIAAGGTCTFEVGFAPALDGTFAATVQIRSNDGTTPTFSLPLSGISEPVQTLTVRINQVETDCPASNLVTAYVSVTDQGGYPLTGLLQGGFSVNENGNSLAILPSFKFVSQLYESVSIAAVMDYSGSQTDTPDVISDMEQGLLAFVDDLRAGDEMEIIKFDTNFQVVQGFTSDKTALKSAISAPFDLGIFTRLYDTLYEAVTNAGATATARRAVIVITDGVDDDGTGNPLSTRTSQEVIDHAISLGVPIFTIGLGDASRTIVNEAILTQIADGSGGQFFGSIGSDNLRTIYQQLSSILFENQYVLQFDQLALGAAGTTGNLTIGATSQGITGNDTKQITSCN